MRFAKTCGVRLVRPYGGMKEALDKTRIFSPKPSSTRLCVYLSGMGAGTCSCTNNYKHEQNNHTSDVRIYITRSCLTARSPEEWNMLRSLKTEESRSDSPLMRGSAANSMLNRLLNTREMEPMLQSNGLNCSASFGILLGSFFSPELPGREVSMDIEVMRREETRID